MYREPPRKVFLNGCHLGGQKTNCARRQPIHVKCLLSDMFKLLEGNFNRMGILRGNVKGESKNIFRFEIYPIFNGFCSATGTRSCSSASTPIAPRAWFLGSLGLNQAWLSCIPLIREGNVTNYLYKYTAPAKKKWVK